MRCSLLPASSGRAANPSDLRQCRLLATRTTFIHLHTVPVFSCPPFCPCSKNMRTDLSAFRSPSLRAAVLHPSWKLLTLRCSVPRSLSSVRWQQHNWLSERRFLSMGRAQLSSRTCKQLSKLTAPRASQILTHSHFTDAGVAVWCAGLSKMSLSGTNYCEMAWGGMRGDLMHSMPLPPIRGTQWTYLPVN